MMNANPNAKISFAYLSRLEDKTSSPSGPLPKKGNCSIRNCACTPEVISPSEVNWQSFKHVRVYLPIVPYTNYINTTTILHENRPKNTRIVML